MTKDQLMTELRKLGFSRIADMLDAEADKSPADVSEPSASDFADMAKSIKPKAK